jgi:hypothetical protein
MTPTTFLALLASLPALSLAADTCTDLKSAVECSNCDFLADVDLINSDAANGRKGQFILKIPEAWDCSSEAADRVTAAQRCRIALSGNGPWGGLETPDGTP